MPRRIQYIVLIALAAVLGYILVVYLKPPSEAPVGADLPTFQPLSIENPALRIDLLNRVKNFKYEGSQRNIFVATLPPPPPTPMSAAAAKPVEPAQPPPPPPLVVPATFFGYVTDARTGAKRAFFSESDDVYVLGIGDVLLGRFRLIQIGNSTAEMEEVASGRRTTLTMEEPGPS